MITIVYLAGAWTNKWAFSPWRIAACVLLDVYWITSLYGLFINGEIEPFVQIELEQ